MKVIEYEFNGQTLHLCLNAAALLNFYEKYGQSASINGSLKGTGKKSFGVACWMLAEFSAQGEFVRRYQGYDSGVLRSEDYFKTLLNPLEVAKAKRALTQAIVAGFECTEKSDEPVDLGLQELEKKTGLG